MGNHALHETLKRVTWLGHSGLLIEGKQTIYFDPFEVPFDVPKADIVFLTHPHYDHCSKEDVDKISSPSTIIVGPTDCVEKFPSARTIALAPGAAKKVAGIPVVAVPAYTSRRPHHPQENGWLGFCIELDGFRFFHAGDTDTILDVKADVMFLPVDNLYNMSPDEAVAVVKRLKPQIAVPIHFGSICGRRSVAGEFIVKCRNLGIEADVLRKTRFGRAQPELPALSPRTRP